MSALIEDLIKDHKTFNDFLEKMSKVSFDSKEGKDLVATVKSALIGHLKKEDLNLYPKLAAASANDERLKQVLDTFAEDMSEISAAAMTFFDKCAKGGADMSRDFSKLSTALRTRMRREESILYPEYEKIKH